MSDTILTEIAKLNNFTRDLCFENGHNASIFEHVSGETLYDATVNILTSTGDVIVGGILLRDALYTYFETHLVILLSKSMDTNEANRLYEMMTRHFYAMGIKEFYVPIAATTKTGKRELVRYTIALVPNNIWGKNVATEMEKLVVADKFVAAMPEENDGPFVTDAGEAYGHYVAVICRCIVFKALQPNVIKTSD